MDTSTRAVIKIIIKKKMVIKDQFSTQSVTEGRLLIAISLIGNQYAKDFPLEQASANERWKLKVT